MCCATNSWPTHTSCHRNLHGAGTLEGRTYKKYLELNLSMFLWKAICIELNLEKKKITQNTTKVLLVPTKH